MKLSEQAKAALERLRRLQNGVDTFRTVYIDGDIGKKHADDRWAIIWEMLRLFPPGHDAEITSERLVASGFETDGEDSYYIESGAEQGDSHRYITVEFLGEMNTPYWCVSCPEGQESLSGLMRPNNMGEVWQLMAKCGCPAGGGE